MNNITFSIVIVNHNTSSYIRKLIETLYKFIHLTEFEIIIVDNNSSKRDIEELKNINPMINLFLSPVNLGFSGGNNLGAKAANSKYLIFMNPDTYIENDCITPLIDQMEKNAKIGIITPYLLYGDKSYQSTFGRYRGIIYELIDALYITRYLYLANKMFFMFVRRVIGKPFRVKWTSGAFMLMRKNDFNKVNGFDEEYPLNYEDMDLCKKILNLGLLIIVDPRYYCIHLESKSQKRNFYNFVYKRYVGRLVYLNKYMSPFKKKVILVTQIFGLYLRRTLLFLKSDENEKSQRRNAFNDCIVLYKKQL